MTQVLTLAAETRESVGKGTARAVRRNDRIPAVIYGDKQAPTPISVAFKDLIVHVNKAAFFTTLFDIEISGKTVRVLPRDVQFNPVTDYPEHVDFLRVSKNTQTRVKVPLSFTNQDKSPGIKRGGSLNIVHHELEVVCNPAHIPAKFEVDLSGYVLGAPVHLSAIKMPEGVKLAAKTTEDFTIASITVPSALRSQVVAEAAEAAKAQETAAKAPAGKAAPAKPAAKK
ncbi:MAG: 50S ribosomal protein L25/general stress protein Ctc [Proteobacteria bacterium]|jgi:large subunit ribosomal protein L25|nr:50S ribosomal protein L25/general stress protein Ctc [Alphaproteobacteria bacterium]NCC02623.1 50S ribosomal protein L25/general stress protein Ctc [Pseudomonadota bacterium]